ncbi:MAG TPA: LLM class flavin-dependent oxidoreductase [Thermomicrobiales bacterium]|nr:LLM class flavin-dependent oxidoreductase [Thermomicrobiales bacterium]
MRVGLGLMNAGDTSSYSRISQIAQQAEALGYDSLWVTEREPLPLASQGQCPVFNGEVVVSRKGIDCTLDALAIAAINTDWIKLGINLPNIPFYSPIDVGQSLVALDRLSDGRVQVGLGLGWSSTEFQSVSSALARPETPASEFVRALQAVWDGSEARFSGAHYVLPRSMQVVTPVQRSQPEIVLTAFAPAAVQQPSLLLRGGSPLCAALSSEEMAEALFEVAPVGGRASGGFDLAVRAVVRLTEGPIGESRAMFAGSLEQIRDDVAFVYSVGATELHFDLSQMPATQSGLPHRDILSQLRDTVPSGGGSVSTAIARQPLAA